MTATDVDVAAKEFVFPTEQDLDGFAQRFARELAPPLVIWLEGDLGAGKTSFARGLIHAMGYSGRVKSPTYGLLEYYQLANLQVLHMDLYRISDPGELEFLGIGDLLDDATILLIEWPDRGDGWLPKPDFIFRFSYAETGRNLSVSAHTPRAQSLVEGL